MLPDSQFFCLITDEPDESLLDQSMSDHESGQEVSTRNPKTGASAPTTAPAAPSEPAAQTAPTADSPPNGLSSEKNKKTSPPERHGSLITSKVNEVSMNAAETTSTPESFEGKGFNPSLYGAIKKLRATSMEPRQTGLACEMPQTGSLIDENTINKSAGYYRHVYDNKMNLCFSFEPRCLMCHSCVNSPHHILGDVYQPACIILSDQHFPAALPAADTKFACPVIIRIEDGSLGDLLSSFRKTMGKIKLPVGSVIIICSLSHLARVGAATYASDLLATFGNIEEDYGNRVRAIHGIPIVGTTLEDENTVRSLFDVLEWLEAVDKRSKYQLPDCTHMMKHLYMLTGQQNGGLATARLHMKLPTGMRTRDTAVFMMGGSSSLAGVMAPLAKTEAATLLSAMTKELNDEFVVNVDTKPDLCVEDRGAIVGKDDKITIIVVGASHASRLVDSMGELQQEVIDLTSGGWTIDEESATSMASEIADQLAGISGKKAVIFQMFDNSIYYGKDQNGRRISSYKSEGTYHIEGELRTISKEELKERFEEATCMFRAAKEVPTIILGPIVRYMAVGCCDDPDHLTNFEDDDYGANVAGGIRALGQYLRQLVWHRRWKNVVVANTTELMDLGGPNSVEEAAIRLPDLMDVWGDSDPIHPRKQAYDSLAKAMVELVRTKTLGGSGGDDNLETKSGSRGLKRPREEKTGRRPDWTLGSVTAVARGGTSSGGHRGQPWGGQAHRGRFRERGGGHRDSSQGRYSKGERESGYGYGSSGAGPSGAGPSGGGRGGGRGRRGGDGRW